MTQYLSGVVQPIHGKFHDDSQFLNFCFVVSVLFTVAAALTRYLLDGQDAQVAKASQILEASLAVVNIGISYGAMAGVARLRNRAESIRILEFLDAKLVRIMRGVFTMMSKEAQNAMSTSDNPFVLDLENRFRRFYHLTRSTGNNHGFAESNLTKLNMAYNLVLQDISNPDPIRQFQSQLSSIAVCDEKGFQLHPLVEDLCDWCSIRLRYMEEVHRHFQGNPRICSLAEHVYKQLCLYQKSLEKSGRREETCCPSSWQQYYYYLVKECLLVSWFAPLGAIHRLVLVQNDTSKIFGGVYQISCFNKHAISPRQAYDVQVLSLAILESDFASLVVVAMFLSHVGSWIVATSQLAPWITVGGICILLDERKIPTRSATTVMIFDFSVVLGAYPLLRICTLLWNLNSALVVKVKSSTSTLETPSGVSILRIQKLVAAQLAVQLLKVLALLLGMIAVEWSSIRLWLDRSCSWSAGGAVADTSEEIPSCGIALRPIVLSLVAWVGSSKTLESRVFGETSCWKNDPVQVGKQVMEAFHDELEQLYIKHSIPIVPERIDNDLSSPSPSPTSSSSSSSSASQEPRNHNTNHPQEQTQHHTRPSWVWEDVVYEFFHVYPLDLVFPADWVDGIVQCLQHGMHTH